MSLQLFSSEMATDTYKIEMSAFSVRFEPKNNLFQKMGQKIKFFVKMRDFLFGKIHVVLINKYICMDSSNSPDTFWNCGFVQTDFMSRFTI